MRVFRTPGIALAAVALIATLATPVLHGLDREHPASAPVAAAGAATAATASLVAAEARELSHCPICLVLAHARALIAPGKAAAPMALASPPQRGTAEPAPAFVRSLAGTPAAPRAPPTA